MFAVINKINDYSVKNYVYIILNRVKVNEKQSKRVMPKWRMRKLSRMKQNQLKVDKKFNKY